MKSLNRSGIDFPKRTIRQKNDMIAKVLGSGLKTIMIVMMYSLKKVKAFRNREEES